MANEEVREKNVEIALQTAYEQFIYYGIEATTKCMIAKASGLSRPSIDRYFPSKTDCVIQAARYIGNSVRLGYNYPDSMFTDKKHTGKELLKLFVDRAKDLYAENPFVFILRNEYKQYVYRHCPKFSEAYNYLLDAIEYKKLIKKIFILGIEDGSFSKDIDPEFEAEYFCESFLGFLGNIALNDNGKSLQIIDKYTERIMKLY